MDYYPPPPCFNWQAGTVLCAIDVIMWVCLSGSVRLFVCLSVTQNGPIYTPKYSSTSIAQVHMLEVERSRRRKCRNFCFSAIRHIWSDLRLYKVLYTDHNIPVRGSGVLAVWLTFADFLVLHFTETVTCLLPKALF